MCAADPGVVERGDGEERPGALLQEERQKERKEEKRKKGQKEGEKEVTYTEPNYHTYIHNTVTFFIV